MSSRPNIDDLFKKELDGLQHEYSESLWQRLDAQLQPERDAYLKKDKKRRAAWLVLPLLLVLGGGTVWYIASSSSSGKTGAVTAKNIPAASENNTKVQPQQTTPAPGSSTTTETGTPATNNLPAENNTQKQPGVTPANNSANNSAGTINEPVNQQATPAQKNNTVVRSARSRVTGNENISSPNTPNIVRAATEQLRITRAENNTVVRRAKKDKAVTDKPVGVVIDKPVEIEETAPPPAETVKQEKEVAAKQEPPVILVETAPVTKEEKAEPAPVMPAETAKVNTPSVTPVKNNTAPAKATGKTPKPGSSFAVSVIGGTNLSSPFRKPGVYGGALFTKTIGDKHIFAGLKIASNQLDHQLISAAKTGQASAETDAVIQKLTILEMPFGYEFALGQKKAKPSATFLQVGFEPAYITGLRTLFYDDQGIPGGPRQEVVNSPLMAKAVNRFNLLFVAGIRKQVTPRIGLLFTGGYSLIDITDKQYYNRTSTNNNLKYVQAGLLFRLNK